MSSWNNGMYICLPVLILTAVVFILIYGISSYDIDPIAKGNYIDMIMRSWNKENIVHRKQQQTNFVAYTQKIICEKGMLIFPFTFGLQLLMNDIVIKHVKFMSGDVSFMI